MIARRITFEQLRQAAVAVGLRVDAQPENRPGTSWRFTLRTTSRHYGRRGFSRRRSDGERRRVGGAVCWHGHRDFMRRLFDLAPDAVIISSFIRYDGAADFERKHLSTYDRNVGSQIDPVCYGDLCDCED
jgi:hypothetical protein